MTIPPVTQPTRSEKGALFVRFLLSCGYYEDFIKYVEISLKHCTDSKEERIFEEFLVNGLLEDDIFGGLINIDFVSNHKLMRRIYNEWSLIYYAYQRGGHIKGAMRQLKVLRKK